MSSIKYYDQNAQEFYDRTINADVSDLYQRFLSYMPTEGCILDAGCGVGRDAKYFQSLGYDARAFDASIEMVKKAALELRKDVWHMTFQHLDFINIFDAIWANASLLHVPYTELKEVFQKLHSALKNEGILFASFKYGNGLREADNRLFSDMNEETILPYLEGLFLPLEIWKSSDTRSQKAASPNKAWLNVICRALK